MRRKRLNHIADTVCHIFCGVEIFFNYDRLLSLGNGILKINLITGDCIFNNNPIQQLPVVKSLMGWMKHEFENNKIDSKFIKQAELTISLEFSTIPKKQRKYSLTESFLIDGKSYTSDLFNRCDIQCYSIIQTDEKAYTSKYHKIREWPQGWPGKD